MIKRCPTCSRTYSDESISFCLADGTLLSAPYDDVKHQPPPTEILPADLPAPTHAATSPPPTMTSLPGAREYSPLPGNEPSSNRSGALAWIALAVVALAVIVIGGFATRKLLAKRTDAVATASPEVIVAENPATGTISPSNPATTATSPGVSKTNTPSTAPASSTVVQSTPQAKSTASPTPATLEPDPVLFPPETRNLPYGNPKESAPTDYNRVFTQREVDVKAVILSRPPAQYTDAARQNQIQGTVVLRAVLSANGAVGSIAVVRGLPYGLSENAIAAAKQMRFTPAMKDGRAVSVSVQIEYNFSIY